MRPFANTRILQETGQSWLQNGSYTGTLPGTPEWFEFWQEEDRRISEGYSVAGLRITGEHYFYLNYTPILRLNDEAITEREATNARKEILLPAFWDGDYEFFWAREIARTGMSQEAYEALGLDNKILSLKGGHHLVVLKARGKGYSYKSGAILAREYARGRGSKNYAAASDWTYLTEDGLLNKAWETIDHLDNHTPFFQGRLKDTDKHKVSGFLEKGEDGVLRRKGRLNQIMGVSCKDDPSKIRGKRGKNILFEEAGKFPGLLEAWEISRPSVEQGRYTTGMLMAYGTGGTDDANYESLEKLFYEPEGHNVLPFENVWDDSAYGTTCSFFVPAHQNWEGYMDAEGNSDYEGAKAYFNEQRELKKKHAKGGRALQQHIAEYPMTPREATLQVNANLFPGAEILAQMNEVKAHDLHKAQTGGFLIPTPKGIRFSPSPDVRPIMKYPLSKEDDPTGAIVVVEQPYRDADGNVPDGLYIIGHDPYAHDNVQSASGSLGSAYVQKRSSNFSPSYAECLVASYVGRPATLEQYNRNLFLLAEYYNAKIGFENDRGDVVGYARRHKKLHLLQEEFKMNHARESRLGSTIGRNYGMHMTAERSRTGEMYIRDWLLTPISRDADGEETLVLHTITDLALLEELLRYNDKGNFDRVKSLIVLMYHQRELTHAPVDRTRRSPYSEFFERALFQ